VKVEQNYFLVLLYIIFFPIILAGPMQRAENLLNQFKNNLCLSNHNFSLGFRLFLWGMFKNFVIGQQCEFFYKTIYKSDATGLYILIQGFSFFLYLYFTFSAYIDIFSGIARIFNIELSRNFGNRPYAASSRKQFWEQWHITLNHWFRDYFFFAIAKNVKSKFGLNLAILATYTLIGLWHGLSLQFFIWGLVNGIWIITEKRFTPDFSFITPVFRKYLGQLYHWFFASLVALLFSTKSPLNSYLALLKPTNINDIDKVWLIKHALLILSLMIPFDLISRQMKNKTFDVYLDTLSISLRWTIYLALALSVSLVTSYWTINNYYFKF
jgi:alginate O-acetyltransferase complex protein AlgI